jgi:hypothetical protein
VAAALGVDYRTIQRREAGEIKIPREAGIALPSFWLDVIGPSGFRFATSALSENMMMRGRAEKLVFIILAPWIAVMAGCSARFGACRKLPGVSSPLR